MKPIPRRDRFQLSRWVRAHPWLLAGVGVALAVVALYLGRARQCEGVGFPLDDAWIHQTYARSLVQTGRLVYAAGQVSLGSTSPLWTALLGLGYVLRIPPVLWAYMLGIASWLLLAWVGVKLAGRLFPEDRGASLWVGLACLAEWHLAWAALSGLEIALFALLSLLLIERYAAGASPVWVGLIGGLLVWTRPEGIVPVALLAGVVALDGVCAWHRAGGRPGPWRGLLGLAAGFAVLWLPYVTLNVVVSGQPYPSTFYAKQAEYRALLARPVLARLWDVVRQPLVGAQVLLVPGFVWQAFSVLRQVVGARPALSARQESARQAAAPGVGAPLVRPAGRDKRVAVPDLGWARLLPVAWWFVYHWVYALRLPVGYQHGRYLMPTIPILLLYGIVGTRRWVRREGGRPDPLGVRVLKRALAWALCCLFAAFLVLGGQAFAKDVCIIRCEMVDVALWLRANVQPGELVAAHDIGAIGYWSQSPLIDLAGLVTPEVIPFIRDEEQLLGYLVKQGADYVATFPSWYPSMVRDDRLVRVYQTGCLLTRTVGGDNMAVYRVRR